MAGQEGSISRTGKESGSLGFNYGPPRIQKLKLALFPRWLLHPLCSLQLSGLHRSPPFEAIRDRSRTPFEAARGRSRPFEAVRGRSRTPESAGDCADDRAGDRAGDHAVIRLEVVIWFWAPILIKAIGTSAALAVGASC